MARNETQMQIFAALRYQDKAGTQREMTICLWDLSTIREISDHGDPDLFESFNNVDPMIYVVFEVPPLLQGAINKFKIMICHKKKINKDLCVLFFCLYLKYFFFFLLVFMFVLFFKNI